MYVIVVCNLFNFLLYGFDKYNAVHKKYRISEKTLLFMSCIAPIGGILGMVVFHHKVSKLKFIIFHVIFISFQIGIYYFLKYKIDS